MEARSQMVPETDLVEIELDVKHDCVVCLDTFIEGKKTLVKHNGCDCVVFICRSCFNAGKIDKCPGCRTQFRSRKDAEELPEVGIQIDEKKTDFPEGEPTGCCAKQKVNYRNTYRIIWVLTTFFTCISTCVVFSIAEQKGSFTIMFMMYFLLSFIFRVYPKDMSRWTYSFTYNMTWFKLCETGATTYFTLETLIKKINPEVNYFEHYMIVYKWCIIAGLELWFVSECCIRCIKERRGENDYTYSKIKEGVVSLV